jgi:hypothetical protein
MLRPRPKEDAVRTRWVIGAITVAVLVGGMAANAAITSSETGPPAGVIRSTRYWDDGPAASYSSDSGNIFTVPPLQLTFPAGSTYDAVVTLTLDYATSAPRDRFIAGVAIREGAEFGPTVRTTPNQRPVAASTVRTTVTLTFRRLGLAGGTEYWIAPTVNVSRRDGNTASIDAQHVLMVVDAIPQS